MTGEVVELRNERSVRKQLLGKRIGPRRASQRRARLVVASGVYDCLVTDISEKGARVRIVVHVAADGNVVLDAGDGKSYRAVRRWARGMEMGLAFAPQPAAASLDQADTAFASIWASAEAMKRLRTANFFDDPTTLQAAEEAEKALILLLAALEERLPELA
jgi:hypothetical protein